jgi:hypothetical protein
LKILGTDISVHNGVPDKKIFVIAVTYKRFEEWCRANDLNPRSKMVRYAHDTNAFRGSVNAWYKYLGTSFGMEEDMYRMLEHCKATRGFKEIP